MSAGVSRRRKVLTGAAVTLLVLVVVAVLLGRGGSWESYPGPERVTPETVASSPGWTRPCWAGRHDGKAVHVFECGRLRGRVLWVITEKTKNGGDAQIIVVAGLRLRYAKLSLRDREIIGVPGIGHRVTMVGPIVRGARIREKLWAWSVEDHGI